MSPVKSDDLKTPFGLLFRCIFHKQAVIFFYLVLLYLDLNRAVLGSAPVDLDQYLSSTQAVSWLSTIHY